LKLLAGDERRRHPQAFQVLLEDFYIDDVASGYKNVNDALRLQEELNQVLGRGGFPLKNSVLTIVHC
jgi:hypothetical protein